MKRMEWSYHELRSKLIEAELWPRGRMAQLACYLAGLAAVLFALQKILGLFRQSWSQHLDGWVPFLTFCAGVLFFLLGFLAMRGQVLAPCLSLGLIRIARDVDDDGNGDLRVKRDRNSVQADGFDGGVQLDLATLYGETALGKDRRQVAGRDRAIELAGLCCLAQHDH